MTICVHGLGFVGLATASLFANNDREVIGFDPDDELIGKLEFGEPEVGESDFEAYIQDALDGSLTPSRQPEPADYHLICVPTPYDDNEEQADLSYIRSSAQNISGILQEGDTVVVESTVPPGTTVEVVQPILSNMSTINGDAFGLGYTPETIMPGNTLTELRNNDRIIGGIDDRSTAAIRELYEPILGGEVHAAPDPTTAEFAKLAQNAARDVEIAYANTLSLVAAEYNIDSRSAIDLANNHPRVNILDPGPGVGGHCLPVDPLFLCDGSDETVLIETARDINNRMPRHIIRLLKREVGVLDDKTVAVLGITYKGNVSDTRNSPGLEIARLVDNRKEATPQLTDGGRDSCSVAIHDPRATDSTLNLVSLEEAIEGADAVIFGAAHTEFADIDPSWIAEKLDGQTVIDPVNAIDESYWADNSLEVISI
ncbi:nucleotide sugar dehydrogenase [Haloarcula litorea]|uniref:nucleotide sugar dehydrogenase n=1 Tax=Haloarcula litorea TaxID=3032579 RepID=UPI0023E7E89E|nr:nucleotide sugar dehydrogenase [Halomicroarcula sp. GDY20]